MECNKSVFEVSINKHKLQHAEDEIENVMRMLKIFIQVLE